MVTSENRIPTGSRGLSVGTAPESSLSWPAKGKLRRALADRLMLSEAIDAVGRMLDANPNGRNGVSDSYIGNMAALLCTFPRLIALQCADPIKGVVTKTKFIPTVADVVQWCEPLTADMQRSVAREDRIDKQLTEREAWERAHPGVYERAEPGANLKPDAETGRHPPGTILSNYDEAVRLYGRPIGAFDDGRCNPYSSRRGSP